MREVSPAHGVSCPCSEWGKVDGRKAGGASSSNCCWAVGKSSLHTHLRQYRQVEQDNLLNMSKRAVDLLITLADFRELLECKFLQNTCINWKKSLSWKSISSFRWHEIYLSFHFPLPNSFFVRILKNCTVFSLPFEFQVALFVSESKGSATIICIFTQ